MNNPKAEEIRDHIATVALHLQARQNALATTISNTRFTLRPMLATELNPQQQVIVNNWCDSMRSEVSVTMASLEGDRKDLLSKVEELAAILEN
jgi:hypothetical protein